MSVQRVTKEDVENNIREAEFFLLPDGLTVLCSLQLKCGMVAMSRASARLAEYFDEEHGKYLSFIQAFEKAWEYTGLEISHQTEGSIAILEYSDRIYQTKTFKCVEVKSQ